ncbi:MAG TPA: hypothetical protein VH208_13155 [Myxococcaceae bacterium]|nr:hypothetical protein [Myxococcaceae bacterium]
MSDAEVRAGLAVKRMLGRTPLNLTAEDEDIMREDWLLDPHKLPQVRIYQELTRQMREGNALRAQLSERDATIRGLTPGTDEYEDRVLTEKFDGAAPAKPAPAVHSIAPGVVVTTSRDLIERNVSLLRYLPRQGASEDKPEGARYVLLSATLVERLTNELEDYLGRGG